jgi:hypothetical protein
MGRQTGDKLGPRIAELAGKYTTAARRDHAPIEARIQQVAIQALIDRAGKEVAGLWGPIIKSALDKAQESGHPDMIRHLERTASGKHQWEAISGNAAYAATGALSSVLSNYLFPATAALNDVFRNLPLDAQQAAQAVAAGLASFNEGNSTAGAWGYTDAAFQLMLSLAETIPDASTLYDLVNRGGMTTEAAAGWLQRSAVPEQLHAAILELRRLELSPADAALAVLRGNMSQADGVAIAGRSGMTAGDFQSLIDNTGEPLALESLLEARRREFIDDARLELGIRESRVRDEWIDVALKLEYAPMSVADAVNAVVQGYFTEAQAAKIAQDNGLEAGQITTLIDTAGEPLSRTELNELWNRGVIDQSVVAQGLRESRMKDKYVNDALQLAVRYPEGRQIVTMITHAAITKAQGMAILLQLGYTKEIATALITEGVNTKLGAHKDLAIGEIRTLYVDGIFTHAQAVTYLTTLGYDTAESDFLIKSWDLLAGAAVTRQAVGAIRTRFVAHALTAQEVNLELDSLGIPPAAKDNYIKIWTIERDARISVLTEAQIVKAHKDTLITGQDAYDRLTARGYAAGDALILLGVAPGAPVPA